MSSRSEAEGRIQSSRAGSSREQAVRVRCGHYLISSVQTPRLGLWTHENRQPMQARRPPAARCVRRGVPKKGAAYNTYKSLTLSKSCACQIYVHRRCMYITYKLANTPTEVCFLSESRKRSGFHSSLSGPQISGKLSHVNREFISHNAVRAHRLYASI